MKRYLVIFLLILLAFLPQALMTRANDIEVFIVKNQEITVYNGGFVSVKMEIAVNETVPLIDLKLLSKNVQFITVTTPTGELLDYELTEDHLTVYTLGASELIVIYDIPNFADHFLDIWTINFSTPYNSTLILPQGSLVISINAAPVDVRREEGKSVLRLVSGRWEIDYIIITDVQSPIAHISFPLNGSCLRGEVDIKVEVNDENLELAILRVDEVQLGLWTKSGSYVWTLDTSAFKDGAHIIALICEDIAGNTAKDAVRVTIDNTSPLIKITRPEEGEKLNTTSITVKWESHDEISGIARIELQLDQEPWIDVTGKNSLDLVNLYPGDHTIKIKAVDVAGNIAIEKRSFIVEAPITPTLTPTVTPTAIMNYVMVGIIIAVSAIIAILLIAKRR
ncbi:hypothetical protein DRN86_00310 [Candidatus Geothermarchaeota archaeon]|nr:MAG: hypothetical protein DRN86_00310 [Candidatus Geothermarchaeota archaeon]